MAAALERTRTAVPTGGMRVGLQQCTYTWDGGAPAIAGTLGDIARNAEAAGFASFWLMDHFFQIPTIGVPERDPMLEAYTALGFVARSEERRVGKGCRSRGSPW